MIEPKYPDNPIYRIESLTKHLGSDLSELKGLAEKSSKYYRLKTKPKKNGGVRKYYSIGEPLKSVLKKIRMQILGKVTYPDYLHGSIRGRSPKTNAEDHIGASCLIEVDILNFFPSIKSNQVNRVFRYFFNFSEDVSSLLTDLITHQGKLPQGSPVSSDIANLVLNWGGAESMLVESLAKKGFRYTRYVDDIAVSSTRSVKNDEKTEVIKMVNSFIKSKGFQVSHKKTRVSGPRATKTVTGLRIGKDRNNIPAVYVDSVYHEIKQAEQKALSNADQVSIRGKINHVKQYDRKQGIRLEKASGNLS